MKVYVTKYALTRGVEEVEVGLHDAYAYGADRYRTQYPPGTFHVCRHEAVKVAEAMRDRRIASLEKQIAKLRKVTFR